jgi:AbrB family looped-hinge helix DNA binding protein
MKKLLQVDRSGRMVLPKEFRSRLNLRTGDQLIAELGVDEIRLRLVVTNPSRIIRHEGRAVWDAPDGSASVEEIEEALQRGREERDARASGL